MALGVDLDGLWDLRSACRLGCCGLWGLLCAAAGVSARRLIVYDLWWALDVVIGAGRCCSSTSAGCLFW